jgi:hypothetical protein
VVYVFSFPLLSFFSPSRIVTNMFPARNIIMIKELCILVSRKYTRGKHIHTRMRDETP